MLDFNIMTNEDDYLNKNAYLILSLNLDEESSELQPYFSYLIEPMTSYGNGFFSHMYTSRSEHRLENFNRLRTWLTKHHGFGNQVDAMSSMLQVTKSPPSEKNVKWAWELSDERQRIYVTEDIMVWLNLAGWK
jgi:hypothetical protein